MFLQCHCWSPGGLPKDVDPGGLHGGYDPATQEGRGQIIPLHSPFCSPQPGTVPTSTTLERPGRGGTSAWMQGCRSFWNNEAAAILVKSSHGAVRGKKFPSAVQVLLDGLIIRLT